MSAMTDDADLDAFSRELLGKLGELKGLEEQKRGEARSTPAFHKLAEEVSAKSNEVLRLAVTEQVAGDSDSPRPDERAEQSPGDWTAGASVPAEEPESRTTTA
jgi:hypothetical protein